MPTGTSTDKPTPHLNVHAASGRARAARLLLGLLLAGLLLLLAACSSAPPPAQEEAAEVSIEEGIEVAEGSCDDLTSLAEPDAALELLYSDDPEDEGTLLAGPGLDGELGCDEGLATTSAGLPSSLFDPYSTAWASVRNARSARFSQIFDYYRRRGYMVTDIEVDQLYGQQRVGAVFQYNRDRRGWASWRNMTSAQFHSRWLHYRDAGYRLIDQESYILSGKRYYAGVWVQNRENLAWASYRNVTSAQFSQRFAHYRDNGFIPVDVEAYSTGNGMRYAAVWVKNTEGLDWYLWRNMSGSSYANKFHAYKSKYRVLDLESYRRSGSQNYAAIWIENKSNRYWAAYRNMTSKGFGDRWQQLRDEGYRLIDFEVYPVGTGYRYAGVWRQNSSRPAWQHKTAVNDLAEDALDDFNLPGLSVAVIQNGSFKYMRGFGYADVLSRKRATSHTVYRLASVSKAVAGALALDMQERGEINLGLATRTYAPSLPNHHTHRVWHTISNRSGIGHYSEHGSPAFGAQFNTALSAAGFFEDDALLSTPGTAYKYSTHAYTILGAALEGAVNKPIANIIKDDLSKRYRLPTLLAEDRSQSNANRATLHSLVAGQSMPISADNLSWKVLGGGLEASAYDLARFGNRLVRNGMLTQASLDTLWTRPDSLANYGYGWDLGTQACGADDTQVVAKGGAQRGAKSYIRVYPELDIVIVVLTNQRSDFSPGNLGRAIGQVMLTTACN